MTGNLTRNWNSIIQQFSKKKNFLIWKVTEARRPLCKKMLTLRLKITEKVSFNIASEASYVYILSGQKLINNAKCSILTSFWQTWSLRSNRVTRQVIFNRTKIGGKCQNSRATFCVIFKHFALFGFERPQRQGLKTLVGMIGLLLTRP